MEEQEGLPLARHVIYTDRGEVVVEQRNGRWTATLPPDADMQDLAIDLTMSFGTKAAWWAVTRKVCQPWMVVSFNEPDEVGFVRVLCAARNLQEMLDRATEACRGRRGAQVELISGKQVS